MCKVSLLYLFALRRYLRRSKGGNFMPPSGWRVARRPSGCRVKIQAHAAFIAVMTNRGTAKLLRSTSPRHSAQTSHLLSSLLVRSNSCRSLTSLSLTRTALLRVPLSLVPLSYESRSHTCRSLASPALTRAALSGILDLGPSCVAWCRPEPECRLSSPLSLPADSQHNALHT